METATGTIRPLQPDAPDLAALERICLLTAAAGRDGRAAYPNLPALPGAWWAVPYAVAPGGRGFVLERDGQVSGYAVGTAATEPFNAWLEAEWQPRLRRRWPADRDSARLTAAERATLTLARQSPLRRRPGLTDLFPAHVHINLLAAARGRGAGRQLLGTLLAALAADGAPGVHLGVARSNVGAVRFYEALGFGHLAAETDTVFMGRLLRPAEQAR